MSADRETPGVKREAPVIMMIAGEISGDTHAARVASEILRQRPGTTLFGAGGPAMKAAGVELLLDRTEHAVVGLTDAFKPMHDKRGLYAPNPAKLKTAAPGSGLKFAAKG